MEWNGVPIDTDTLHRLNRNWESLQLGLIGEIDQAYGVYEGRSFRTDKFETFLTKANIPWPRLGTGRLALGDDAFDLN